MSYGIDNMIEVKLRESDDFLKVRETLTRIGIASKKERKLYQSCHILHKRGKYYIVHFKELFALDGKPTDFTDSDRSRRNAIINLLVEWGLIELTPESQERLSVEVAAPMNQIKIISHKEKSEWELVVKYNIGKKRKVVTNVEVDF
jgi:hypothetical protein